jgi:hypothetical protein
MKWICHTCETANDERDIRCAVCKEPRKLNPDVDKKKTSASINVMERNRSKRWLIIFSLTGLLLVLLTRLSVPLIVTICVFAWLFTELIKSPGNKK